MFTEIKDDSIAHIAAFSIGHTVCQITHTPTHAHAHDLILKLHAEDLKAEHCASTHTHLFFLPLQDAKHIRLTHAPMLMHAGYQPTYNGRAHPTPLHSSHPLPYTCQAHSKVTHLNYPARTLTHTQTHTQRESQGGEIQKEGARADFTLA